MSGLDHLLDSIIQRVYLTKQRILERLGRVEKTIAASTLAAIDRLYRIEQQYSALLQPVATFVAAFKVHAAEQKALGLRLYDLSLQEDPLEPDLSNLLREMGEYLRDVEREGVAASNKLDVCLEQFKAFHDLAIPDCFDTLERFTDKRQRFDAALSYLDSLKIAPNLDIVLIRHQESLVASHKEAADSAARDLEAKVVLLNDKRMAELGRQVERSVVAIERYVRQSQETFSNYKMTPLGDHERFLPKD